MTPALCTLSTFEPSATKPSIPPLKVLLPHLPALGTILSENLPAHLNGDAPPSARIEVFMNLGSSSSNSVTSIRPSTDGSIGRTAGISVSTAGVQGARGRRNSITLNISESESFDGNNGWDSPTGSTMSF
ncbi:hypothetical protein EDD21DRAFT_358148 [Dissophora ornata]|nr:hypothetical protein EDD21DRAFT_358148 [Dissophora ornata]